MTDRAGLELWGGHECTVNRVGGQYFDQTVRTGHHERLGDLARFAEAGIKALRYPVLWERVSPERPDERDWRWSDERLTEIRRLGMRPIVGLTHHGSGPHWTGLVNPSFAPGLAAHAGAVAERYPWVDAYTPVNEPLTTARFSTLYGHWHPHLRDETAWWVALFNQIDATRLSMCAIRAVNPQAQLIQTEDLGHTFSTPQLSDQAEFENARRWLTWDLLTGRVIPGHYFWERLEGMGLADRARVIADDPCPPQVVGVNHYLTSERFLDHRFGRYPEHTHGRNYQRRYADVEAVRVLDPAPLGLERLLELTWERYGIPLAVTESHNGCTREEQMRWTYEAWVGCERLRARGVPVEAVTVWALLGGYDWDRLLTVEAGGYECGAFDVRGDEPRATGMVSMMRSLATSQGELSPVLSRPGWWRRDIRHSYEKVDAVALGVAPRAPAVRRGRAAPILIAGRTGMLGRFTLDACRHRELEHVATDHRRLRIEDPEAVAAALDALKPWAVVNAAGWSRVDEAEDDPAGCMAANAAGAGVLAQACAERGIRFVTYSSDLVFDGRSTRPYVETDVINPLSVYGRSKAEGERLVLEAGGAALVVRTGPLFSPTDTGNFAVFVARELAAGRTARAASDRVVSPTYVYDLVRTSLDLLIDGETGLRHLVNGGAVSWAEFAVGVAEGLGLNAGLVRPVCGAEIGWAAERPRNAALGTERGQILPSFESALGHFADHFRPETAPAARPARAVRVGTGRPALS